MDKRSGFWYVDLTPNAQELLAFITPQERVFKWKVMPFGVGNALALFQELINKILSILRRRPVVQELISWAAQMKAHIDDVCLGTNTQEDHLILLGEFFAVCQENHMCCCGASSVPTPQTKRSTVCTLPYSGLLLRNKRISAMVEITARWKSSGSSIRRSGLLLRARIIFNGSDT